MKEKAETSTKTEASGQSLEQLSGAVINTPKKDARAVVVSSPNDTNAAKTARSRVTVYLPEDAKLYVNGSLCPLTSGKRSFVTPSLDSGKRYYYTLRVDHEESGRTNSHNRKVVLFAGQNVEVHMNLMSISH